ncbi:zinc finger protein ZAT5-like isoform X2 [Mercurialis annua]|uniref:zinc finger protein ZAT5-like isoform X2 n=1 Tax=Mercurialis annua TaxID=3986 RepID=UPI00215E2435|nr:zinc finger protein ZAT5-like isoform X2 [Mercurialis annua]
MDLAQEQLMGSHDNHQIIKGKRTKRQRSSSPGTGGAAATVSSSSSSGGYAQGDGPRLLKKKIKNLDRQEKEKLGSNNSRKLSQLVSSTKSGFYIYECKTCNRSFPSFQALGGHRASHKKPKAEEKKASPAVLTAENCENHRLLDDCRLNKSDEDDHRIHPLSLHISSVKTKIHECSICGSEFSSGQALGGHMRRHRAAAAAAAASTSSVMINGNDQIKKRPILCLDLNLPAPEDDQYHHRESKFQFVPTQKALVFSAAPTLVDCHY